MDLVRFGLDGARLIFDWSAPVDFAPCMNFIGLEGFFAIRIPLIARPLIYTIDALGGLTHAVLFPQQDGTKETVRFASGRLLHAKIRACYGQKEVAKRHWRCRALAFRQTLANACLDRATAFRSRVEPIIEAGARAGETPA